MRVLFVAATVSLPSGMASTQRLTSLARGVKEAGGDVMIALLRATETREATTNNSAQGQVFGIPFCYTTGTPYLAQTKLGRQVQDIRGLLGAWRVILGQSRRAAAHGDSLVVVSYTRFLLPIVWVSLCCRLLGVKLVAEMCEWPLCQPASTRFARRRKGLFCRWVVSFIDGAIPISGYIEAQLRERARKIGKRLSTISIPILADPAEIQCATEDCSLQQPYVLFGGSVEYRKTIEFILDAFCLVAGRYPGLVLVMTGMDERRCSWLSDAVVRRGLGGRVVFTGFLPRGALLSAYRQATALLIPLFGDSQSQSRFPSKMAEYLLSGRPVVTNAVGESMRYLEAGRSAYMAEPDRADLFAASIQVAIEQRDEAGRIGQRGLEVALENFDYRVHGKRLASWLSGIAGSPTGTV